MTNYYYTHCGAVSLHTWTGGRSGTIIRTAGGKQSEPSGCPRIIVPEPPLSMCVNAFRAGELHKHYGRWCKIVGDNPSPEQATILRWIRDGVSIFDFFRSFSGSFKGQHYQSDRPPPAYFRNSPSCKPFTAFVKKTLLDRLRTGAISLKG